MYTKINLKDYGVIADGVFNNAPLIKEILQKIDNYTEVIFPEGVILLGDGGTDEILLQIEKKHHIIVRGVPGKTKILAHPNTPVKNRMGILHVHRSEYCDVFDLELDGNSQLRHSANNGINWGDNSTVVNDCSNLMIDGSNYVHVKNVYSHHPAIDCLIVGRYAGGDTKASHHVVIEDCIFDYGYRQGISITGSEHGIIRNCKITNTAKALDLYKNDGVSTIGTPPKAGIDSETWIWNHDWLIEGCHFENNTGGHINVNDGASEHIIRDNYFVGGSAIGCETPSRGTRSINNIITNNHFLNSSIGSLHGAFLITNNVFFYDDVTNKNVVIAKLSLQDTPRVRGGNIVFSDNKVSVDLNAYQQAGIDISEVNAQVNFGPHVMACNNTFHNLISQAPVHIANANGLMFSNNTFTSSVDMRQYITSPIIVIPNNAMMSNNSFEDSQYPSTVRSAYNPCTNNVKFTKDGNRYTRNLTFNIYRNRKVYFKIANANSMSSIFGDLTLRVGRSTIVAEPYEITYKVTVHKNGNDVKHSIKRINESGDSVKLLTCSGFELKDDILYLCFVNEFCHGSTDVNVDFDIHDMSGEIMDVVDLHAYATYENITSPYPASISAGAYEEGELVRSHSSNGGIHLYRVANSGVVNKPQQLHYAKNYNIDGVVFEYVGPYQGVYNLG